MRHRSIGRRVRVVILAMARADATRAAGDSVGRSERGMFAVARYWLLRVNVTWIKVSPPMLSYAPWGTGSRKLKLYLPPLFFERNYQCPPL